MPRNDTQQIETYKTDLASGRVFMLHAMSARGEIGYRPPINRASWAHAMGVLAEMAAQSDAHAQFAHAIIGRVNLYGTDGQCRAAVYEAAAGAITKGYRDTIGQASPEPNRESDATRAYTLGEIVEFQYWLAAATAKWANGTPGVGWVTAAIAEESNTRIPRAYTEACVR